jgi:hypothetical protein
LPRDEKCVINFGRKTLKGRDHPKDICVDGRRILKWILWKCDWTGLIGLKIGTGSGSEEFVDRVYSQILMKNCAPWSQY